jgi:hypothetical protein
MGVAASEIATTEEWVAATLDRLAHTRPNQAQRLRARAAEAREYAALERDRAMMYGFDPSVAEAEERQELEEDHA